MLHSEQWGQALTASEFGRRSRRAAQQAASCELRAASPLSRGAHCAHKWLAGPHPANLADRGSQLARPHTAAALSASLAAPRRQRKQTACQRPHCQLRNESHATRRYDRTCSPLHFVCRRWTNLSIHLLRPTHSLCSGAQKELAAAAAAAAVPRLARRSPVPLGRSDFPRPPPLRLRRRSAARGPGRRISIRVRRLIEPAARERAAQLRRGSPD